MKMLRTGELKTAARSVEGVAGSGSKRDLNLMTWS